MKKWWKVIYWIVLGAAFGTITGILARELGYWSITGGILAGMIAAPLLVTLLLLVQYWDRLILWTIGGAVVGAASLTLMGYLTSKVLSPLHSEFEITTGGIVDRALIGAAVACWLASGGAVFKKGTAGMIGLLSSVLFGAPLGALIRVLGSMIGVIEATLPIMGETYTWSWTETLVGMPVGVLMGMIATKYLFQSNIDNSMRRRAI